MDVTIAIPILNGEEYLEELIEAINKQKTDLKYEILVIDSGSTDRTIEIVKRHESLRMHEIPNSEFGHGKTRNLAAELAGGKYIIYLTQDAVPAHKYWLESMVEPFTISDKVACVVGRQIPHANAPATIKREVATAFNNLGPLDAVSLQRQNKQTENFKVVNTFLSNTNSAVRKDLLEKIPFRDVNYAEDQGLGIDMLAAGYYKAYAPLGAVDHSHDYSVREYFSRKYDEYVGLRHTTGIVARAGLRELILGSIKVTLRDWIFIVRDKQYSLPAKLKNFLTAPFYNIGLRLAIRAASNQKISSDKHEKMSLEARSRRKAKN